VIVGRPYLADGSRLVIHRAVAADYWPFEEHHYLTGHATGTRCWLATVAREPVAWCSTIRQVGSGGWRVHRLVVLPEARGRGIATLLLRWVAEQHDEPVSIRTHNAAFVEALVAGEGWRPSRHGTHPTAADERTGRGATAAQTAVYVGQSLRCEGCGVTTTGRSDRRFCSTRCRVRQHRARRRAAA
jgi:GNAT superfamily N-acetyltransferase